MNPVTPTLTSIDPIPVPTGTLLAFRVHPSKMTLFAVTLNAAVAVSPEPWINVAPGSHLNVIGDETVSIEESV